MYGIVLKDSARISRDALMARLSGEGIETRPFFTPMHRQPMLQRYGMRTHGTYAVSDRLAVRGLYLPSGSNLNEEDLLSVAESVKRCLS
jgi:perosamine synthetase